MVKSSQEEEVFLHGYTVDIFFEILSPFPYIKTLLEVSDHVFKKYLT